MSRHRTRVFHDLAVSVHYLGIFSEDSNRIGDTLSSHLEQCLAQHKLGQIATEIDPLTFTSARPDQHGDAARHLSVTTWHFYG